MRYRPSRIVVTVLALVLLLTAGCSQEQPPSTETGFKANRKECLNPVKGPGDLEVTDTAFTQVDDGASYAVEVTNTSKTDTAMIAEIQITLVDDSGEDVPYISGPATDTGVIQYLAPGESQYWAGTWSADFDSTPVDMKVDLPHSQHPDVADYTFWWPHDDVDYPADIDVDGIKVQTGFDVEEGGDSIDFVAHNDSDTFYPSATAIIVLRDTDGELIGGQEVGPVSPRHVDVIDLKPGSSKHELFYAFEPGFPDGTDTSNIEVQINNALAWNKLDPNCKFGFDAAAAIDKQRKFGDLFIGCWAILTS